MSNHAIARPRRRLMIRAAAALASAAVLLPGAAGARGGPPTDARHPTPDPLQIVITNDDGIDNAGLEAARDALCDAGHEVTVVAPANDKSGTSGSLTSHGEFTVERDDFPCGDATGESWALDDAYPGDTVLFAVDVVYGGQRPDLVVSGINPGPNVGDLTTNSGTVGATVAASNLGIPAVAVSVGMRPDSAPAAYPDTSDLLVELIDELQRTQRREDTLLPRGTALNVNYPGPLDSDGQYDPGQVKEPRLTTQASSNLAHFSYEETSPGVYTVAPGSCDTGSFYCATPGRHSDMAALDAGHVSITPIDGDYTSPRRDRARLIHRIRGVDL